HAPFTLPSPAGALRHLLGPDVEAPVVCGAGVGCRVPHHHGSRRAQCVVEQVAVFSPAALDGAVGELPFAPAFVYRQVAETEFAQLFLLHLFQPLSG
ncbi:MAG: hypothetical protein ACK559_20235, partial [bacterium]